MSAAIHTLRAGRLAAGLAGAALVAGGSWRAALLALTLSQGAALAVRLLDAPNAEAPARRILDPAIDAVADFAVFAGYLTAGLMQPWLLALLFAGEAATPYLRAFGRQNRAPAGSGRGRGLKRAAFALAQLGVATLAAGLLGAAPIEPTAGLLFLAALAASAYSVGATAVSLARATAADAG